MITLALKMKHKREYLLSYRISSQGSLKLNTPFFKTRVLTKKRGSVCRVQVVLSIVWNCVSLLIPGPRLSLLPPIGNYLRFLTSAKYGATTSLTRLAFELVFQELFFRGFIWELDTLLIYNKIFREQHPS